VFLNFWRRLKVTRRIGFGPVSLTFKFERSVRVTQCSLAQQQLAAARVPASQKGAIGILQRAPAADPGCQSDVPKCAVIVGVGPGFGHALARLLAAEGFDTILVSRDAQRLSPLVAELREAKLLATAYGADATDEPSVSDLFARIQRLHGPPSLVVYSIQNFGPGAATEVEVPAFEAAWRNNCLGAFLVAKAAAELMKPRASGTIVLVGSTSSLIGRAGHLNLAVGKFGQRALAQVMARELWPQGIHVAHAVIDADIAEGPHEALEPQQSDPDDIACAVLALHRQPRTAWTSELDLRPWNESFWEHC